MQLSINKDWALRALVKIYEKQTIEEKRKKTAKRPNGVGFNRVDAEILSSFAEQVKRSGDLTEKQLEILFKRIPKYASQMWDVSDQQKIKEMVIKCDG
jgi:hypothetical protein